MNITGDFFDAKPQNDGISPKRYNINFCNISSQNLKEIKDIFSSCPSILIAHRLGLVRITGKFNITLECLGYRSDIPKGQPDHDRIAWLNVILTLRHRLHQAQIHCTYSIHLNKTHHHNIGVTSRDRLDDDTANYYFGPVFNYNQPDINTLTNLYCNRRVYRQSQSHLDNLMPFEAMMSSVLKIFIPEYSSDLVQNNEIVRDFNILAVSPDPRTEFRNLRRQIIQSIQFREQLRIREQLREKLKSLSIIFSSIHSETVEEKEESKQREIVEEKEESKQEQEEPTEVATQKRTMMFSRKGA